MSLSLGARSAPAALLTCLTAAGFAAPAVAGTQVLSPWDAQRYSAAFAAGRAGDWEKMAEHQSGLSDDCLVGYLSFTKLFHPRTTATYEELTAWLEAHGDLPMAERVWNLANRRKPEGAEAPRTPASMTGSRLWSRVETAAQALEASDEFSGPRAAREALNAGRFDAALRLGVANGDRWVAGLAAYRLNRFEEAMRHFEHVATDPLQDGWVRSGGAYWAARSAEQSRSKASEAPRLLRLAAAYPFTFYGLIAERKLGLESSVSRARRGLPPVTPPAPTRVAVNGMDEAAARAWMRETPRARRAVALAQIGMREEAALELREGLRTASDDDARDRWTMLALSLNTPLTSARDRGRDIDLTAYPTPPLEPQGGWRLDRALVLALARKESRFDPRARSSVGAYGLMQVMPTTAAYVSDDPKLAREPDALFDPGLNLRLGQQYVEYLFNNAAISGDLLRAVAAYNGGPSPVSRTVQALGPEADSLLVIESIPVPQSRQYVEEVVASYWIYRQMMGLDTPTLDAVASGARLVPASLDFKPEPAAPADATATVTAATPAATAAMP